MNNRLSPILYKKLVNEVSLLFSSFVTSLLLVALLLAFNNLDTVSRVILPTALTATLLSLAISIFILIRKTQRANNSDNEQLEEILQLQELRKIEYSRKKYQKQHHQVETVLEMLPKHDAQILRLSLFRRYSTSQIAEEFHRPEHKVRQDLIKAFKKMEALLRSQSNTRPKNPHSPNLKTQNRKRGRTTR